MMDEDNLGSTWESESAGLAAERPWVGLHILFHPDLSRIGHFAPLFELGEPASIRVGRNELEFRHAHGPASGPLASRHVSRAPATLCQNARGEVSVEGEQVRLYRAADCAEHQGPVTHEDLERGMVLALGGHVVLWLGLQRSTRPVETRSHGLVGRSRGICQLRAEIERVSDLEVAVLLRGETGSGKELVASAIHRGSRRASAALVCVNMAAVPPTTAASELFGHRRGAFTGAIAERKGYFGEAHGGTLFLDEIGDTPGDIQPMLLRAIELGVVQPLGGTPHQVDVRVIAATDSNLEAAIQSGQFRSPLLRRFGYSIRVPALRERREDIGLLFAHFLEDEQQRFGPMPSPTAQQQPGWLPAGLGLGLMLHAWPGNVRELRNVARRVVVRSVRAGGADFEPLSIEELGLASGAVESSQTAARVSRPKPPPQQRVTEASDDDLARAWKASGYRVEVAASSLGLGRTAFLKRLKSCKGVVRAGRLEEDMIRAALATGSSVAAAAARLEVSERALRLRMAQLGISHGSGPVS